MQFFKTLCNISVIFSQQDLHVFFRLTLLVPTQSSIRAEAIRNVLLSESTRIDSLMNNTQMDRTRISVRMLIPSLFPVPHSPLAPTLTSPLQSPAPPTPSNNHLTAPQLPTKENTN